jgi:integrase
MPALPQNAVRFTDRSLRTLKTDAIQVDFMDLGLRGFGLRVFRSGRKTFFARYRYGRGFRRFNLGDYPTIPLRLARANCKDILARVARGEDPQTGRREERSAMTFPELAKLYLDAHAKRRLRERSWREDERVIRHDLLPHWRQSDPTKIRRRDVARLLDGIIARGAPVQANRTRAVISRIFAFAVSREIAEHNPVAGLPRPSTEQARQRVLSEDEIRAFWATWEAESSVTSALFRMLLLTAQRKQEVIGMRWADIHGSWWTIPAATVKNKLVQRVYLTAEAQALLASLRPLTGAQEWVFASPRRPGHKLSHWLSKAKQRFRSATGVQDWRPHDLRRTAATYMGRMGVSRTAIARVLNHAEKGVTAIYDRSTGEPEIEHALRLWGQRLEEILHRREAPENVVSMPDRY